MLGPGTQTSLSEICGQRLNNLLGKGCHGWRPNPDCGRRWVGLLMGKTCSLRTGHGIDLVY